MARFVITEIYTMTENSASTGTV